MDWVLWIMAVAVLGVGAVVASGRLGSMGPTVTDTPKPEFPSGTLTSADLRDVRFAVVPRGYSMDQVDELLDRLAVQLSAGPEASDPDDMASQVVTPEADEIAPEAWAAAPAAGTTETAEVSATVGTSTDAEPTLPRAPQPVTQV